MECSPLRIPFASGALGAFHFHKTGTKVLHMNVRLVISFSDDCYRSNIVEVRSVSSKIQNSGKTMQNRSAGSSTLITRIGYGHLQPTTAPSLLSVRLSIYHHHRNRQPPQDDRFLRLR